METTALKKFPRMSDSVPTSGLPMESSALASVNYYSHINMLELEFQSGAVYLYFDVPPYVYNALLQDESAGQYFNANIRDAYRYVRVI